MTLNLAPLAALGPIHKPGIYEDMPREEYDADPSLSQSGIKDLGISPIAYWANSLMNPDREDSDTAGQAFGRAAHVRLLEGPQAFADGFTIKPEPGDVPGALRTVDDLKGWLSERDAPTSGTKLALKMRAKAMEGCPPIWDDYLASWQAGNEDKTVITRDQMATIGAMGSAISDTPEIAAMVDGGKTEVSAFWRWDGIPMKARADKRNHAGVIDLKTYANKRGIPLDRYAGMMVAEYRYDIQAFVYSQAFQAPFWFLFVEKSLFPDLGMRQFAAVSGGEASLAWQNAENAVKQALHMWRHYYQTFGTDPWRPAPTIRAFEDIDFPYWSLNR